MKLRITLEGSSYEVDVEVLRDAAELTAEEPEADPFEQVDVPPPPPDIRPEDRICHSPIAGAVVAVHAKPGLAVLRDDPMVVLEAMKMQVPIGAPLDGVVEEVLIAVGDAVAPGQVLFRLR
jgi:biotin carboxyl carrier protein